MYTAFYTDFGFFVLRFAIGVILISHSMPKLLKHTLTDSGSKIRNKWLVIGIGFIELFGGFFVVSGLWIRGVSVLLALFMIVVMYFHIFIWKDRFRSGWDMTFLAFILFLFLALTGGGNWRIIL